MMGSQSVSTRQIAVIDSKWRISKKSDISLSIQHYTSSSRRAACSTSHHQTTSHTFNPPPVISLFVPHVAPRNPTQAETQTRYLASVDHKK